jgi:predicted metal-dependent HD superfamily phosphohydrolase
MLKNTYTQLIVRLVPESAQVEPLWREIETRYSEPHRAYHNLTHLELLIEQLSEVKTQIEDWDTILFSVFYHDIVYSTTGNTNEEQSADIAVKRLSEIGYPAEKIKKCHAQILATKGHTVTSDNDTDLFTDADLSILGQTQDVYMTYAKQIRSEYSQYPDEQYKPGRKKVLEHFLKMDRIYKSEYFFTTFEKQARANLQFEIDQL